MDLWLDSILPLNKFNINIAELMSLGACYKNGERFFENTLVKKNDLIRIHLCPRRFSFNWETINQRIILETENLLFLNKPPGIPSHPTVDNYTENVLFQLNLNRAQKLLITHRLDQETSGIMIFAKNRKTQEELNSIFKDRKINKHYVCIVSKPKTDDSELEIKRGQYIHWMKEDPKSPKLISDTDLSNESQKWQRCELEILKIENLKYDSTKLKLTIKLITGRTHQIRAQMAYLKLPIVGDRIYNPQYFDKEVNSERLFLQAFKCTFQLDHFIKELSKYNSEISISEEF